MTAPAGGAHAPTGTEATVKGSASVPRWRRVVSAVALVVGCVLVPVSLSAVWVRNTLLDTDNYVATVQPLASEPAGDLDLTLATMSANPHLVNVATMVSGAGPDGVRKFYDERLIGQFFPPDVEFTTVSRTHGEGRLVDELIISFTHTTKIDWMLPGVEPTGKHVSVAFVVIVGVEGDKISYEHIYWDQATVLVQIGLLDPTGLPVVGAQATAQILDPTIPGPHY